MAQPILLLEGFYAAEELPLLIRHRLIPVVHRLEQLDALLDANWPADLPVYLKLNTGMNRLGFDAEGLALAQQGTDRQGGEHRTDDAFRRCRRTAGIDRQVERFKAMTAG